MKEKTGKKPPEVSVGSSDGMREIDGGANVVYDDWLVGEDIFVFGGHSARAARIDCGLRVVSRGKGLRF